MEKIEMFWTVWFREDSYMRTLSYETALYYSKMYRVVEWHNGKEIGK